MTNPREIYPRATFVPITIENVGGALDRSRIRLIVVHVAQSSTQSGIDAWFKNPAAQVSAHFSVSRTGIVHQYAPLSALVWAQANYNDVAVSIEHVGYSGQRLTRRQLRASLALLAWLHEQLPSVPLRRTADPNGRGVIGHGELGVVGGDHPDCPGWPILAQFNVALRVPATRPRRLRLPFLG